MFTFPNVSVSSDTRDKRICDIISVIFFRFNDENETEFLLCSYNSSNGLKYNLPRIEVG